MLSFLGALSASGDFSVEFRYNGYNDFLPIPNAIVEKNKAVSCSSGNISEVLDFWKTKLVCIMWEAEKNAFENNFSAFEKNIYSLRKYILEIDKSPEKDLILSSCYAIVLESLTRILQSHNSNIMTEELLYTALSVSRLNSKALRHFYTYANMLILAKKIYIYRKKNHCLPNSLSKINDIGKKHLDGWGNKIMYTIEGDDFYLFSDIGKSNIGRKISQYVPIFSKKKYNQRLVFSSNMSMRRSLLWKNGKLIYSGLHIMLDKTNGTVSYFYD